jgi:hypothetical protein
MRRVITTLLISTGLISAGVIDSNTVAYSVDGSETDHFTQFNPALGTLTGVTLFYTNSVEGFEAGVTEDTSQSPAFVFADFESGILLTLPGVTPINPFLSVSTTHFGCESGTAEEFESCTNTQTFTTNPPDGSIALSPSPGLSAYIGTGTVTSLLEGEQDITNVTSSMLAAASEGVDNVVSTGDYYLEYTYTPASSPTPEPASMAMLGAGLAALGVIARKRSLLS